MHDIPINPMTSMLTNENCCTKRCHCCGHCTSNTLGNELLICKKVMLMLTILETEKK